jgi:chromosome partitioning protein
VRILTIANQKGGAGKTTLAVHLAVGLAARGHRTLLIDCDPQANASQHLGTLGDEDGSLQALIYQPQRTKLPIQKLEPMPHTSLGVVPAWIGMALSEMWSDHPTTPAPVDVARRMRDGLGDAWDWVVVDAPPGLAYWNSVALDVADQVLIPVPATGPYPLMGLTQLESIIARIRYRAENPRLRTLGIVATMVDTRNTLGRKARETIATQIADDLIFHTTIPMTVSLQRVAFINDTVWNTDPAEPVTEALANLIGEVETRWPASER